MSLKPMSLVRLSDGRGNRLSCHRIRALRLVSLAFFAFALYGCGSTSSKVYVAGADELPKKIVVFFDGTNNDETADTNVKRLHSLVTLRRTEGTGAMPRLATIYIEGIGTDGDVVGMGTGAGTRERVLMGYEFLLSHYRTGDEVFLVGFSRGAYSARILASLLFNAGLPHFDESNDPKLKNIEIARLVFDAVKRELDPVPIAKLTEKHWEAFEKMEPAKKCSLTRESVDRSRKSDNRDRAFAPRRALTHCALEQAKLTRLDPVEVDALVLWDTVEALGFPNYGAILNANLRDVQVPINIDVPNNRYGDQLCNVKRAYQALSLDDNRERIFTPLPLTRNHLFDDCGERFSIRDATGSSSMIKPDHLQEVWFSGAHSDVGGGYENSLLSGVSLNWMLELLQKHHNLVGSEAGVPADKFGTSHNPNSGWLGPFYREFKRNVAGYYVANPERRNYFASSLCVHPSVFERRAMLPLQSYENHLLTLQKPEAQVCLVPSGSPGEKTTPQRLEEAATFDCLPESVRLNVEQWPACAGLTEQGW